MDLTPREEVESPEDVRRRIHRKRRWAILALSVLLVVAVAFVTAQGLRNATLFFRNVDEGGRGENSPRSRPFGISVVLLLGIPSCL